MGHHTGSRLILMRCGAWPAAARLHDDDMRLHDDDIDDDIDGGGSGGDGDCSQERTWKWVEEGHSHACSDDRPPESCFLGPDWSSGRGGCGRSERSCHCCCCFSTNRTMTRNRRICRTFGPMTSARTDAGRYRTIATRDYWLAGLDGVPALGSVGPNPIVYHCRRRSDLDVDWAGDDEIGRFR